MVGGVSPGKPKGFKHLGLPVFSNVREVRSNQKKKKIPINKKKKNFALYIYFWECAKIEIKSIANLHFI